MASSTMSHARVFCGGAFTTENIYLSGNNFKMIRVYADSISAKMVKAHSIWDLAFKKLISYAMGVRPLAVNPDSPIVTISALSGSSPNPTCFSFLNLSPKTTFNRYPWSHMRGFNLLKSFCKHILLRMTSGGSGPENGRVSGSTPTSALGVIVTIKRRNT